MRKYIDFNSAWTFTKQDYTERVDLPHTWNAVDGQDGGDDYFRGTCVYEKHFYPPELKNERLFIEFQGAAMSADVALNGKPLVSHAGGYSTFRADMTDLLVAGENLISVSVDNSVNDTVYPQRADFTFYGGIYRPVRLIIVPEEHFELIKDGTPGIKVTPVVNLTEKTAHVTVETWHNAASAEITVNGVTRTVERTAEFDIPDVHLWDGIDDPYLYTATAKLASGDEVTARFGCREFHIDPDKGFFLNGRSYPLRGVARHQDRKGAGNAVTDEMMDEDMAIIREIGANTVRLAHYQHPQHFYDLCDENGLIVWAEIPYITYHMLNGRENTVSQMKELITQCYNHPSVVCWGLSNEITFIGKKLDALIENNRALNDLCHHMDKTRPTTMAHISMLDIASPVTTIADISSYNLYFGWYGGELKHNGKFLDSYHALHPDKPIGLSEYGADANPALHNENPEMGDYTEEYQCVFHEALLDTIEARPYLWATHVWNMFDFAADGRAEGNNPGFNQKGLVTADRKLKKDAFYIYKAHWNKAPFVHLCGRRYVKRTGDTTKIKVYSTLDSVTLYVDGKKYAEAKGKYVFNFEIPLNGTHTVRAEAGGLADEMTIQKVSEPEPSYQVIKVERVMNWLEED
ncbi:MAG: glycoside hydrolase family 2 protein [Clostridia bacterium]|nr:glycoside hydrolase family 2 protein [Clostridia bacterium]